MSGRVVPAYLGHRMSYSTVRPSCPACRVFVRNPPLGSTTLSISIGPLQASNSVSLVATGKRHDCHDELVASILAMVLEKGKPAARQGRNATGLVS